MWLNSFATQRRNARSKTPTPDSTMDFSSPTLWWLVAGVLIAVELATGTFYLLMLALGAAAAAVAAHLGAAVSAQWLAAAVVGAGATAAWHFKRAQSPRSAPVQNNADANIDIGQSVHVDTWASDGSSRVHYRGSTWQVRYSGSDPPAPGPHVIVSVQSGHLGVSRAP